MIDYYILKLKRLIWPDRIVGIKLLPEEFGGGKSRGDYTADEVKEVLCSRSGCGRMGHATWAGCADDNIKRPLCPECDIDLNRLAMEWWGDPDWERKIVEYANQVEEEVGRKLNIHWMFR